MSFMTEQIIFKFSKNGKSVQQQMWHKADFTPAHYRQLQDQQTDLIVENYPEIFVTF